MADTTREPGSASTAETRSSATHNSMAPVAPGRDMAIDVMRGLCIVSMTTAHLAAGSWPWQATPAAIFINGAVGFVLLSGLVVGITQRRKVDTVSTLAGEVSLFRRTTLIYCAHLALCAVAFLTVALDPARLSPSEPGGYSGIDQLGGPLPATLATLGLQVNPHYTSILSLYVVLLLLAMAAVAALSSGLSPVVVVVSLALYGAGYRWPTAFTVPSQPGVPGAVNWATWQLLFVGALLVGWYWRTPPVRWGLASRLARCCAAALVLTAAGIGWLARLGLDGSLKALVSKVFTEGTLSPATILMAFAGAIVGYPICRSLVRVAGPALSPIARIGRRSLDCYIILSIAVITLPSVFRYDPSGAVAVAVTIDLLVVMFGWCLLRDRVLQGRWAT